MGGRAGGRQCQSGAAVDHIDSMGCHLDGIFAMLADMQSIIHPPHLLAPEAATRLGQCIAQLRAEPEAPPYAAGATVVGVGRVEPF